MAGLYTLSIRKPGRSTAGETIRCCNSRAASNSVSNCWLCFHAVTALCTSIAATANPLTNDARSNRLMSV